MRYECIGVSTNLFNNPKDILGTVVRLTEDFPVVEIELENKARNILDAAPQAYAEVVEGLAELRRTKGTYLSVHAPYIGGTCDLSAADETIRKASCDLLTKAVQFLRRHRRRKSYLSPWLFG